MRCSLLRARFFSYIVFVCSFCWHYNCLIASIVNVWMQYDWNTCYYLVKCSQKKRKQCVCVFIISKISGLTWLGVTQRSNAAIISTIEITKKSIDTKENRVQSSFTRAPSPLVEFQRFFLFKQNCTDTSKCFVTMYSQIYCFAFVMASVRWNTIVF